mmetsp:Transcript_127361/g.271534  ORF Transcript_127361/g.271534 Transcript_127361/m.271534 type:complete len:173 (-) Transcript_127361:11-529(-)
MARAAWFGPACSDPYQVGAEVAAPSPPPASAQPLRPPATGSARWWVAKDELREEGEEAEQGPELMQTKAWECRARSRSRGLRQHSSSLLPEGRLAVESQRDLADLLGRCGLREALVALEAARAQGAVDRGLLGDAEDGLRRAQELCSAHHGRLAAAAAALRGSGGRTVSGSR